MRPMLVLVEVELSVSEAGISNQGKIVVEVVLVSSFVLWMLLAWFSGKPDKGRPFRYGTSANTTLRLPGVLFNGCGLLSREEEVSMSRSPSLLAFVFAVVMMKLILILQLKLIVMIIVVAPAFYFCDLVNA
jgi:hypothetical protein